MLVVVQRHIYTSLAAIVLESGGSQSAPGLTLIHPKLQGIGQWRIRANFRQKDLNVFGFRHS